MADDATEEIMALYSAFYGEIFAYCCYRLFRKDVAADATAEVFVRLVEEYGRLRDQGKVAIRKWLYGTASNAAFRYVRDSRRQMLIFDAVASETWAATPAIGVNRLDWPILYQAIGKLKPQLQEIIIMRFFQGMETHVIAEILDLNHSTVRSHLLRAVKKLKQELKGSFE